MDVDMMDSNPPETTLTLLFEVHNDITNYKYFHHQNYAANVQHLVYGVTPR